jgi:hypothetical protein
MRRISLLGAVVLLTTAAGGVDLPWLENYFFPIGAWMVPTNDESDWLDYDDGTGKTIDDWQPPDYSSMLDLNLDYGRVHLGMTSSANDIENNVPFDVDSDGVSDITQANAMAVEELKVIGVRTFLRIEDLRHYNNTAYT